MKKVSFIFYILGMCLAQYPADGTEAFRIGFTINGDSSCGIPILISALPEINKHTIIIAQNCINMGTDIPWISITVPRGSDPRCWFVGDGNIPPITCLDQDAILFLQEGTPLYFIKDCFGKHGRWGRAKVDMDLSAGFLNITTSFINPSNTSHI
ncbi:MAG: hypothetical protein LBJ92_00965 [Holosporales bacterium]|nr:hypothetical protein [Holosporales bacterium]